MNIPCTVMAHRHMVNLLPSTLLSPQEQPALKRGVMLPIVPESGFAVNETEDVIYHLCGRIQVSVGRQRHVCW